ncbi:helix-turn-helix transcriptional regulator [Actinocrispum wychmicini]|uniref:helix-turn-helix transcriptional regulator n=1 Tax=Actinocrispum wychmicini TaxID=1213861 RepID=UPI001FB58FC3|nr:helix-turn-helix transcriptional regulator [Actinocrispum wychmicini]
MIRQRRGGLATRREVLAHTQESFAYALGVDRSTVSRWERGESVPEPLRRRQLAAVLKVSLEELDVLLRRSGDGLSGRAAGVSGGCLEPAVMPGHDLRNIEEV